jgi:putative Holliday junction resolvase
MTKVQNPDFQQNQEIPKGRLLALDLGQKRVGVAVSDELQTVARALPFIQRTNWKKLLRDVTEIIEAFDAQALVIGLPLNMNESESESANEARRIARNFSLSLKLPVFLQDERLTSVEANARLSEQGFDQSEIKIILDGEAAAIILQDFLSNKNCLEAIKQNSSN